MKSSLGDNAEVDRHELDQQRYWDQLRQELQQYKDELGATNSELAEGMAISRQPLVSFMQNKRPDLPVHRSHLMRLWERLTSPEYLSSRRLSQDRFNSRQALYRDGPNRLLKAAGFLPEEEGSPLEVNPQRYQQIQRIVSGLSNVTVQDDTDFVDLVDSLETSFITKAFGFKRLSQSMEEGAFSCQNMSEHTISQWIDGWIKENLYTQPLPHMEQRFRRALSKLIRQGKYNLRDKEIFELYLSVLENDRIDKKVQRGYRIRINQCQFSGLTFSILDLDVAEDDGFRDKLMGLFLYAEAKLRFSNDEDLATLESGEQSRYLRSAVSELVTEASVTCVFRSLEDAEEQHKHIRWSYRSSATHFENMFTAIYQGMGYERDLELVNFSTVSLGNHIDSLVKSSTTFKSQKVERLHQGIWVDRSTVVATAQSVVVAVTSWLADNLPDSDAYACYHETCTAIAEMDYYLSHGSKVLSDYVLQQAEEPFAAPARDYLIEKVINRIEQLRTQVLVKAPILEDWYGINLERKYCWAQIACARSYHVEGDLKQAAECLQKAAAALEVPGVDADVPLALRLNLEQVLQDFYGGDPTFIAHRVWRETLQPNLGALQKYIYGSQSDSTQRRYYGRLDANVYLCASEIFARVGRLEFTFATADEIDHLMQAADHLLVAAYYASKVGERQRCTHWLANASRVYCRLGEGEMADKLANAASQILRQAVNHRYSDQYKEAIMAEIHISNGEKALLIDQDRLKALHYFGRALQGAAYLGFVRLLADSLYDIARAADNLDQPINVTELLGYYSSPHNKRPTNPLVADVIDFLFDLDSNAVWADVVPKFKQQAKKIWHYWATTMADSQDVKHPIEDEIDNDRYLQYLGSRQ